MYVTTSLKKLSELIRFTQSDFTHTHTQNIQILNLIGIILVEKKTV